MARKATFRNSFPRAATKRPALTVAESAEMVIRYVHGTGGNCTPGSVAELNRLTRGYHMLKAAGINPMDKAALAELVTK